MSSAEQQFLCSICLDIFKDPVSTSCGHNFCRSCITSHWDASVSYQCPMCKEVFPARPNLKINTFISEMVSHFRRSSQHNSSEQRTDQPGEVLCDICSGSRRKAVKSCLVCLVSYCHVHIHPHLTVPALKRHQLIDAVGNLDRRVCPKHNKPLEFFCQRDHAYVCLHCIYSEHRTHTVVPLKEEYEGKKVELERMEADLQQMIQERQREIQELQHSVDLSEKHAEKQMEEGVKVFAALRASVDRRLNELIEAVEKKQRTMKANAEDVMVEVEQEISKLMDQRAELKQLSQSEDHLHLLQRLPSLRPALASTAWMTVSIRPPSYEGVVASAVARLDEELRREVKTLLEAELRRIQSFAVDVTLDPDSAHPRLILSDDSRRVSHGDVVRSLPENPQRFTECVNVLGRQSFSSGRFYFEVQVKGKTAWDVGVARESVSRKGKVAVGPLQGFWIIWLRNQNEYEALDNPAVRLCLRSQPEKVGVFVDYEEGVVSFYDTDAAALIYTFTGCDFRHTLRPFFSPCHNRGGENSASLVLSPVNQTPS